MLRKYHGEALAMLRYAVLCDSMRVEHLVCFIGIIAIRNLLNAPPMRAHTEQIPSICILVFSVCGETSV